VSVKGCSSLVRWSNIISKHSLTLSEHLIVSDCGNLSSFPISSTCRFSPWSAEPIEHSSTHWQLGWLKAIWLDFSLLQLLESESEKDMWHVITRRIMLWHRNDRSSYNCPGNWTVWEQTSIPSVERTENPVSGSLESKLVLVTIVLIVSFNYHGSWIEEKYDEIYLTRSHDNEDGRESMAVCHCGYSRLSIDCDLTLPNYGGYNVKFPDATEARTDIIECKGGMEFSQYEVNGDIP